MSGAILILSEITPVAERAAYMGLIGGMWGIASYVTFIFIFETSLIST